MASAEDMKKQLAQQNAKRAKAAAALGVDLTKGQAQNRTKPAAKPAAKAALQSALKAMRQSKPSSKPGLTALGKQLKPMPAKKSDKGMMDRKPMPAKRSDKGMMGKKKYL